MFNIIKTFILFFIIGQINAIEHINSLCDEGFELSRYNGCEPVCDPKCGENAICEAPQQCICFPGYVRNAITNECEEDCYSNMYIYNRDLNQCVLKNCSCVSNGYCLYHSDECECFEGYFKISNVTCVPDCLPKCINADCIGPNKCKCWPGYDATELPNVCEPHIQNTLAMSDCHCKVDYVPYVIGISAMVISLILVVLHIVERRQKYFVKVIRQHAPQPLVEDDRYMDSYDQVSL